MQAGTSYARYWFYICTVRITQAPTRPRKKERTLHRKPRHKIESGKKNKQEAAWCRKKKEINAMEREKKRFQFN